MCEKTHHKLSSLNTGKTDLYVFFLRMPKFETDPKSSILAENSRYPKIVPIFMHV